MADANEEVRRVLKTVPGVHVVYQYPKELYDLPTVSYYTLAERGEFARDNVVTDKISTVQLDIWGASGKECTDIAAAVYKTLTAEGWYHEHEADIANPDKAVYHRTARYTRTFAI